MPGIAGILATVDHPEHAQQLRTMVESMRHQPDSARGTLHVAEIGLRAGWVAHAGSQAARESEHPAEAGVQVLFCGEWFGPDAQRSGALTRRYEADGERFVEHLNGQFSGLVVDRARRQALLFNDRFGCERLYAVEHDGALYFASEAKALLAVLPFLRAFDDDGVAQFLAFGSTLGGRTLFRGLRLIDGGSAWRLLPQAGVQRRRFFSPTQWEQLPTLSDDEYESQLASRLDAAMPGYLGGEHPIGLSLTGGLDTRMIIACLPAQPRPALAYTYAAEHVDALLDLRLARRISAMRHLPHEALTVGADFLADFGRQLDRTAYVTDGCAGVMGTHELYLSEKARALAPVRLTGNFGSEVLRSMSTFRRSGPASSLFEPALAARVDAVVAEQAAREVHPVTHAACEEVPWHLAGLPLASRSQLTVRTPYMDNAIVELAYRAPAHQRRSQQASLRLIEHHDAALARIPTDRGVVGGPRSPLTAVRKLFCDVTFKLDYWHKQGLPDQLTRFDGMVGGMALVGLLGLHKFLAYRPWFRRQLAPYAAAVIGDARTRQMPFWRASALQDIVQDHVQGRRNRLPDIHAVLTLEAIQRNLLDSSAWSARAPS